MVGAVAVPLFSDMILEPSEEPKNPQAGQLWVPKSGKDAGELHIWSPKTNGWLNLYDNSTRKKASVSWWRKLLIKCRMVRK
jgi:hypothetical protein